MAVLKTKIELTEKDVLKLVAEKYDLKLEGANIRIYTSPDYGPREPAYSTITVEAEKK